MFSLWERTLRHQLCSTFEPQKPNNLLPMSYMGLHVRMDMSDLLPIVFATNHVCLLLAIVAFACCHILYAYCFHSHSGMHHMHHKEPQETVIMYNLNSLLGPFSDLLHTLDSNTSSV